MITAVDTSVLLDVFTADPNFVAASQTALREAIAGRALDTEDNHLKRVFMLLP